MHASSIGKLAAMQRHDREIPVVGINPKALPKRAHWYKQPGTERALHLRRGIPGHPQRPPHQRPPRSWPHRRAHLTRLLQPERARTGCSGSAPAAGSGRHVRAGWLRSAGLLLRRQPTSAATASSPGHRSYMTSWRSASMPLHHPSRQPCHDPTHRAPDAPVGAPVHPSR